MTEHALDLSVPLTFDPHLHLREIVLVGCGGTGGHLARLIARLLVHAQALRVTIPTLRLVDPDTIEDRNIGRQLYSPAELGLNKAEATARRLACALGLPVEWAAEPFDPTRHMTESHGTLVIDAVDNHAPRQALAHLKEVVVLACGNERTHGQVSLGNLSHIPVPARWLARLDVTRALPQVPTAYALFPALLTPEPLLRLKVNAPKPCTKRCYSQSSCTTVSQLVCQTDINLKVNAQTDRKNLWIPTFLTRAR
jgi:hypothetical protein